MISRGTVVGVRSISAPRSSLSSRARRTTQKRLRSRTVHSIHSAQTRPRSVTPLRSLASTRANLSPAVSLSSRFQDHAQSPPAWDRSQIALGAAAAVLLGVEGDRQSRNASNEQLTVKKLASFTTIFNGKSPSTTKSKDTNLQNKSMLSEDTNSQNKNILSKQYDVDYSQKLGQGAFGSVYLATHRETGDKVALKRIDKKYTDDHSFQREMNALLHLRMNGGHPNISGLREDFDDDKNYSLILDLVSGGEMFDHLVERGAYSEADASRLISEVASALAFLHGIGIVHGDLKPENLMLTSTKSSDSVIQVVDFGCAEVHDEDAVFQQDKGPIGRTPAYSPPEAFENKKSKADPALDIWALGVILYIMLTGMHPFDLEGGAPDEEIERRVRNREAPPLDNSKVTAHLSDSSIDLIKKLVAWDPKNRLTAIEMLDHPWVKGDTALTTKIEDSDTKLSNYRKFKSQIESKIFADLVKWADEQSTSKNSSLIERSFRSLDEKGKGFLSLSDLQKTLGTDKKESTIRTPTVLGKFLNMFTFTEETADNSNSLSLSGFSNLVSESMKNKHFPKGKIVYKEGDKGDHMYFINSGSIEVSTKDGSVVQRKQGKFFGEGALLHPEGLRSGTIKCLTPVHAIEISREYFEKYLTNSESGLFLSLREKDNTVKRNRVKAILRLQPTLVPSKFRNHQTLYKKGTVGESMYILEKGKVDVTVDGMVVFSMQPGDVCGEHSLLTGKLRNTSATCVSDNCIVKELHIQDFKALMKKSPKLETQLVDINLRREFRKALVLKIKKSFPSNEDLREAFDAADEEKTNHLTIDNVRTILHYLDKSITDKEISGVIGSMALQENGYVTFEEFKAVFGMDEVKERAL
mmetsp:Transcript_21242/g.38364  ORF Transcript_21242/g.38364 Transcript_21242/m.38364 type:complete len:865 (-) Transcript_21242:249-2843(-)